MRIVFGKPCGVYQPGDTAAFAAEAAERYVRAGIASYVPGEEPKGAVMLADEPEGEEAKAAAAVARAGVSEQLGGDWSEDEKPKETTVVFGDEEKGDDDGVQDAAGEPAAVDPGATPEGGAGAEAEPEPALRARRGRRRAAD